MINKILKIINSIPKDKVLHYGLAYIMFDTLLSISAAININPWLGTLISIAILSIAIVAKEIYDKVSSKGISELGDIYAGYLGAFTKLILFAIALLLFYFVWLVSPVMMFVIMMGLILCYLNIFYSILAKQI